MTKLFRIFILLAVPGMLALASCNQFEDDVMPVPAGSQVKLNADYFTTRKNVPVHLPVLTNDTVQVNGTLVFRQPAHGTISGDSLGFLYKPDLNFLGKDQFYYLYQSEARTDSALVSVAVQDF